jgi:hypothetical protein
MQAFSNHPWPLAPGTLVATPNHGSVIHINARPSRFYTDLLVISIAALSLCTSQMGWNSSTTSPSCTGRHEGVGRDMVATQIKQLQQKLTKA